MPNEFKIKNGLIVDQGGISVTGSALITGSVAIVSSGSSVFTVDGTSGRLFSIDDSLSGSLFSVNTAAGLPVIEAFSDNTIRIGQFGRKALFVSQSKVGIGKETDLNGILDISGSVTITGSLFARGSGSTIISISGSLGELFKVIDTPTNLLAEVVSGSYKALEVRNDLLYTSGAFQAGGTITGKNLILNNSSGDEGGELLLAKPTTNTTIAGTGITIDAYQNRIRIFEQGGNARGTYLDITKMPNSVGSEIVTNTYTGSISISSGSITMKDRPAFRVTGAGGAKVAVTRLSGSYLNVDYQQGSGWDNSTGTFTAPIAGLYQVNLITRTNSNSLGTISQLIVYKNNTGGTTGTTQVMIEYGANTTMNHVGGSTISKLEVGDTLRVVVATGEISFDLNDNFSVAYIG
jgi:hypothetical protein